MVIVLLRASNACLRGQLSSNVRSHNKPLATPTIQMRHFWFTLSLLVSALHSGCAMSPNATQRHDVVAYTGKVIDRVNLPDAPGSTVNIPVIVGPLMLSLQKEGRFGGTGFNIYEIRVAGPTPTSIRVAARGEVPIGTCLDVLVSNVAPERKSFPVGEATLRMSSACPQ